MSSVNLGRFTFTDAEDEDERRARRRDGEDVESGVDGMGQTDIPAFEDGQWLCSSTRPGRFQQRNFPSNS